MRMSRKAAITVYRSLDEAQRLWHVPEHRPEFAEGADVRVAFAPAPGDRGTEIVVEVEERGGKFGGIVGSVAGSAQLARVKDQLRHFKQLVETGEITALRRNARGRAGRAQAQAAPGPAAAASETAKAGV